MTITPEQLKALEALELAHDAVRAISCRMTKCDDNDTTRESDGCTNIERADELSAALDYLTAAIENLKEGRS